MNDTSPEAAAVQLEVLRKMEPWRRLRLAMSWSTSLRDMIRASLRDENREASEETIDRMLADRWLGPELAADFFDWKSRHGR